MSDKPFSVAEFQKSGGVLVPPLCEWHRHNLIVTRLRVREDAKPSWIVWYVCATILLFQGTVADPRFQAESDGTTDRMNAMLADVGCPACANDSLYRLVVRVMRKGLDHATAVSKMEKHDDDWSRWLGRTSLRSPDEKPGGGGGDPRPEASEGGVSAGE